MTSVFRRDELHKVVCNLRTPDRKSGGERIGTGFFVAKNDNCYIVTASHVAATTTEETVVVLCDNERRPHSIRLRVMLGFSQWRHHPLADISVAGVRVEAPDVAALMDRRFFPFEQINLSTEVLSRDTEMTSIGFPQGLGAIGERFSPLSFRTFVASEKLTLPRFDTHNPCEFFVLENPSVGGYSGCPVLDLGYTVAPGATFNSGTGTRINGVMHGTIGDETGGKMAAVTPCHYLNGWL